MTTAPQPHSFETRKIDLGILEAQDAIKLDPNNWDAYFNLANIYFSQKEYKLAEDMFLKILEAGNKGYAIYRGLGNVCYTQKRYKEAAYYFEKAVDINYKDPESHYALALVYEKMNNDELFVQECTRALVVDKNFARAHYSMGFYYARSNKLDAAIKELEKAVQISPAEPDAHFMLVDLYLKKSRTNDAMRETMETLKYDPKHVLAHYQMGLFAEQFEDYANAVHEFLEVRKLQPSFKDIEKKIRETLHKEVEKYQAEIRRTPKNARPYLALADLYFEAGALDSAAKLCEQVLSFDKNNVAARTNLGVIYASVEKYMKAIVEYKKALATDPNNPHILENLNLAFRLGLQFYRGLTEKDPANSIAWDSLIVIHKEKQDHISVIETYEEKMRYFAKDKKALQQFKAFGDAYLEQALKAMKEKNEEVYQVGLAYWALGDLDAALHVFQLITDGHPKDVRALYLLGLMHQKKGDLSLGLQYFQKAYRINPSYRDTFVRIKDICTEQVESLKQKLKHNENDIPALVEISDIYIAQQFYRDALKYLELLCKLKPDDIAYRQRYEATRGDLIAQLERAVEQGTTELDIYLELGALHEENNKLSKAIQSYARGLDVFPAEQRLKERHVSAAQKAVLEFEKYLQRSPQDAEVWYALASFAATVGYRLKALDALAQAAQLRPSFAEKAKNSPEFKDLRSTQRFQEIMKHKPTEQRIDHFID